MENVLYSLHLFDSIRRFFCPWNSGCCVRLFNFFFPMLTKPWFKSILFSCKIIQWWIHLSAFWTDHSIRSVRGIGRMVARNGIILLFIILYAKRLTVCSVFWILNISEQWKKCQLSYLLFCVVENVMPFKKWAANVEEISKMFKGAESEWFILIIIWIMIHIKKHKTTNERTTFRRCSLLSKGISETVNTPLRVNTFCVMYAVRTVHSGFTVCTVCTMLLNLKQSTVRPNVLFGSFSYAEQKI